MLDQLTYEQMQGQVGSTFRVNAGGQTVDFVLVRAGRVMESERARLKRTPFSLFFQGPPQPFLPQSMYGVRHPAFGDEELPIFFVPIAREADGFVYEAVFT